MIIFQILANICKISMKIFIILENSDTSDGTLANSDCDEMLNNFKLIFN